jgi:hypothetical protein
LSFSDALRIKLRPVGVQNAGPQITSGVSAVRMRAARAIDEGTIRLDRRGDRKPRSHFGNARDRKQLSDASVL